MKSCEYVPVATKPENETNCCLNENAYSGKGPALCSLLEEKWFFTGYIYFRVLDQIRCRTGFVSQKIKLEVQLMCFKP